MTTQNGQDQVTDSAATDDEGRRVQRRQAKSRLWRDAQEVVYSAVTLTGVLIAVTSPRWDTSLAACALCFALGRWSRRA